MQSEANPPRVVVDSNLFVSALITRRGTPHELPQQWRAGRFVLMICQEQRAELVDVLGPPEIKERYRLTDEETASFLLLLDTLATLAPLVR